MNNIQLLTIDDLILEKTCEACPEQYDVFIKDFFADDGLEQIGYLRLRHGCFRADYPDCGGKTIYQASPRGDGCFLDDEREFYLNEAKKAIVTKYNYENCKKLN